jgi:hypothetical protein
MRARIRTIADAVPRIGPPIALGAGMEPIEYSRLEKALILAAFVPFIAIGMLMLFA